MKPNINPKNHNFLSFLFLFFNFLNFTHAQSLGKNLCPNRLSTDQINTVEQANQVFEPGNLWKAYDDEYKIFFVGPDTIKKGYAHPSYFNNTPFLVDPHIKPGHGAFKIAYIDKDRNAGCRRQIVLDPNETQTVTSTSNGHSIEFKGHILIEICDPTLLSLPMINLASQNSTKPSVKDLIIQKYKSLIDANYLKNYGETSIKEFESKIQVHQVNGSDTRFLKFPIKRLFFPNEGELIKSEYGTNYLASKCSFSVEFEKGHDVLLLNEFYNYNYEPKMPIGLLSDVARYNSFYNFSGEIVREPVINLGLKNLVTLIPTQTIETVDFNSFRSTSRSIKMNKIPEPGTQNEIFISETHITQYQWISLSILMSQYNKDYRFTNTLYRFVPQNEIKLTNLFNGQDIPIAPNFAVKVNSAVALAQFFEMLNVLSNLNDSNIQSALKEIIPDHQQGYVYSLPTKVLLDYLTKGPLTNDEYKAIGSNPVATFPAHIVSNQSFYDVHGSDFDNNIDQLSDSENLRRSLGFRLVRFK